MPTTRFPLRGPHSSKPGNARPSASVAVHVSDRRSFAGVESGSGEAARKASGPKLQATDNMPIFKKFDLFISIKSSV